MAMNYVQDGKTIPLVNGSDTTIFSGSVVTVGGMVAIAVADIPTGETGDGFTEGVFMLPKSGDGAINAGDPVRVSDGVAQGSGSGDVYAGVAWESAAAGDTAVNVKINATATTYGS